MRRLWVVVAAVVVALAACTSDASPRPEIGAADAYLAIVKWELGRQGPPPTDAALPVIYITSSNGQSIDAGVQAKVAKNSVDEAKVRFADTAKDATEVDQPDAPVHDDGVLLIVDPFDGTDRSQLQLPITVYRRNADQQRFTLSLLAGPNGVSVTAAQPSGAD